MTRRTPTGRRASPTTSVRRRLGEDCAFIYASGWSAGLWDDKDCRRHAALRLRGRTTAAGAVRPRMRTSTPSARAPSSCWMLPPAADGNGDDFAPPPRRLRPAGSAPTASMRQSQDERRHVEPLTSARGERRHRRGRCSPRRRRLRALRRAARASAARCSASSSTRRAHPAERARRTSPRTPPP